jgi:hypothetical protein
MSTQADTRAATGRTIEPDKLADDLGALYARALAGDAGARAEYQAAHERAHNPRGPEDDVWMLAWSIHTQRGRPRRENQSRRFLARVQADVVRTAIHELRRPLIITNGTLPRTRSRGAGRPAARRASRSTGPPADDAAGGEPDLLLPALRRGLIPHARAPPDVVSDPNLTWAGDGTDRQQPSPRPTPFDAGK